jgi:hypothetical protein
MLLMRLLCALGVAVIAAAPSRVRADPSVAGSDQQTETPSAISATDLAELRAELARQGRELEALEAREAERSRLPVFRISGYTQVDFTPYQQLSQNEINFSTGTPLNQNRFNLRRARLRVEAERGLLSTVFEIDANTDTGLQLRPVDAEIGLRWPEHPNQNLPSLSVSAGLIRIPFGFEVPELDSVRPFLERTTLASALFPGQFDLGIRLRGQFRFVDLAVAVMNGSPIGARSFPAWAPVARKELVGRLGVSSEPVTGVELHWGVSVDTGRGLHPGTPTTKDRLVWRDDNSDGLVQSSEVQVIPGSSATPSQEFQRFALGADASLAVRWAPDAESNLCAEIVQASNLDRGLEVADPISAGYDLREFGWYVRATQEITRWGLIGVRYDRYNPDSDASEQSAAQLVPRDRSYRTLALLAMLRFDSARLAFEYDLNRNALGRDSSGAPTNLKSNAFTVRAQVKF